jgi:hypothetical protein
MGGKCVIYSIAATSKVEETLLEEAVAWMEAL